MKKKLFAILLCLIMVVGFMPTLVMADETTSYNIWVDGEQVTSENKDSLCGGAVSYDPATHTLSLNNATLNHNIASDYAIKTTITGTLKIQLTGENSIARSMISGGIAIASEDSVMITGNGSLEIDLQGNDYDAINVKNDVTISDNANVKLISRSGSPDGGVDGGKGIVAQGNVVIDGGAKLDSDSKYVGIEAQKDITIDNSEVKCISDLDGAILAVGNLTVKGGAKLIATGSSSMGCGGKFTVEEADVDAKNTGSGDTPAISLGSLPVIDGRYQLKSAKTVDSQGNEIDILADGTQHFADYKNVHFITEAIRVTKEFYITKEVKQNGTATPPAETFKFVLNDGLDAVEDRKPLEYYGITLLDELKISTNGTGLIDKLVNVQIDMAKVNADNGWNGYGNSGSSDIRWYSKTFILTEVNESKDGDGWDYSSTRYALTFKYTLEDGEMTYSIHEPSNDVTFRTAKFTNAYTADKSIEPEEPIKPEEPTEDKPNTDTSKNPQTGDNSNMALWIALLLVSGGVLAGTTTFYSRKRKA